MKAETVIILLVIVGLIAFIIMMGEGIKPFASIVALVGLGAVALLVVRKY